MKTKLLTIAVLIAPVVLASSSAMAIDANPAQADVVWNGTVPLVINNDDIVLTGDGATSDIGKGTLNGVTNKALFSSSVIVVEAHENVDQSGQAGNFIQADLVDWQITAPVFVTNGTAVPFDFASNIKFSNDGVILLDNGATIFSDDNSKLNLTVLNEVALDETTTLLPGEEIAVQATVLAKLNAGAVAP